MINNSPPTSSSPNVYVSTTPPANEKECAICLQSLEEGGIAGHTSSSTPSPVHFCHVDCLKEWSKSHNHPRDQLICALCKQSIDHSAFFKSDPININVTELTYDDFFSDDRDGSSPLNYSQMANTVGNVAATIFLAYNRPSSPIAKLLIGPSAILLSATEIAILSDYFAARQNPARTDSPVSPLELGIECLVGATMGHLNAQVLSTFLKLGESYATR